VKSKWRTAIVIAATLLLASQDDAHAQQGVRAGNGVFGTNARSMFRLFGSQGSSRGSGVMSSSVTTLDGHPGYFAAGKLQPFVVGVTPVVGEERRFISSSTIGPELAGPPMSSLQDRVARLESMGETLGQPKPPSNQNAAAFDPSPRPNDAVARNHLANDASTATDAVDSIASIRRQREAAKAEAYRIAADHFSQGARAEAEKKPALALYYYKIARRDGDDAIRRQAQVRIAVLERD
jgi:hypothetical protein